MHRNVTQATLNKEMMSAPIAQLDRVIGYEPIGREFESLWVRHLPS